MGSSASAYYDMLDEETWNEEKRWVEQLGEKIKKINPRSQEFNDLEYWEKNKKTIIRNRRLIDLLY